MPDSVPGTEIMAEVYQTGDQESGTQVSVMLVPKPTDDPHDPLVRGTAFLPLLTDLYHMSGEKHADKGGL